jgi:hypothetical protein
MGREKKGLWLYEFIYVLTYCSETWKRKVKEDQGKRNRIRELQGKALNALKKVRI